MRDIGHHTSVMRYQASDTDIIQYAMLGAEPEAGRWVATGRAEGIL